ncbi:hypothetical protein LguiA_014472 [Lonicera macranthoides]
MLVVQKEKTCHIVALIVHVDSGSMIAVRHQQALSNETATTSIWTWLILFLTPIEILITTAIYVSTSYEPFRLSIDKSDSKSEEDVFSSLIHFLMPDEPEDLARQFVNDNVFGDNDNYIIKCLFFESADDLVHFEVQSSDGKQNEHSLCDVFALGAIELLSMEFGFHAINAVFDLVFVALALASPTQSNTNLMITPSFKLKLPLALSAQGADPNCFDSSIWNDISLLEEIDFTAIQLEATSKVLYPDVDKQAMKIEPHSQIQMKCADLNLDSDEGTNLRI